MTKIRDRKQEVRDEKSEVFCVLFLLLLLRSVTG